MYRLITIFLILVIEASTLADSGVQTDWTVSTSSSCFDQEIVTIFFDDFTEPNAYPWLTPGPYWDYFMDEYMREYFYVSTIIGGPAYGSDTLYSPIIGVPQGIDSLVVVCPMSYYAWCVALFPMGQDYTHAELYAVVDGEDPVQIWEFLGLGCFWSAGSKSIWSWNDTVEVPVPADIWSCGDSIVFILIGTCYAEGVYDAIVELDWKLDSFSLLGFSSVAVSRNTWGGIKSVF